MQNSVLNILTCWHLREVRVKMPGKKLTTAVLRVLVRIKQNNAGKALSPVAGTQSVLNKYKALSLLRTSFIFRSLLCLHRLCPESHLGEGGTRRRQTKRTLKEKADSVATYTSTLSLHSPWTNRGGGRLPAEVGH